MKSDEESNSGFPVALSAPGQLNVPEEGIDNPLSSSLEACTGLRMHATRLAKTNVDSAVMVFGLHCTRTLVARSAVPLPSSSTIH